MGIEGPGLAELRNLAARLKEAGDEGKGFRRELLRQLGEAAKPIAKKIASEEHLKPYLPDRYAGVLAPELLVGAQRILSRNPQVNISARTRRQKRRKVVYLDKGFINHPKWPGDRPRSEWKWANGQTGGMKPGFFTDPCRDAAPDIREHLLQAIAETDRKIAGHG
jgi:hypothetical protein